MPTKTTSTFTHTKEAQMKSLFFTMIAVLISISATAGTDVIYSGSHNRESITAGNIYFPSQGIVNAWDVCFDSANHVFKTTIPATTIETCSFKGLIPSRCEMEGGRIISTPVPAKNLTAPEYINTKNCTHWNRSDSTHPVCDEYQTVQKRQPVDYSFMKYEVEIRAEYYNDPSRTEVRDMNFCK